MLVFLLLWVSAGLRILQSRIGDHGILAGVCLILWIGIFAGYVSFDRFN